MNLLVKGNVNILVKNAKNLYVKAAEKQAAKKRNQNHLFVSRVKRRKDNAITKKTVSVLLLR